MEEADIFLCVYLPLIFLGPIIGWGIVCVSCCGELRRQTAERNAAELARREQQARTLAAAAAAPVVAVEQNRRAEQVERKELGYFPYSGAVEASGQRQVCAICVEALVRGAACSEVPACRHVFHRDCIGAWMKNGRSTCPMCTALIVPGSERLSAAEDMV